MVVSEVHKVRKQQTNAVIGPGANACAISRKLRWDRKTLGLKALSSLAHLVCDVLTEEVPEI